MSEPLDSNGLPGHDYFLDAVNRIDQAVSSSAIPVSAAKGIVYSLVETVG